jgi:hypothetical protein
MAGVEFESFGENPDEVKAARIPNYFKHDFFRLDRLPLSFGNLLVRSKPDELKVYIETEP